MARQRILITGVSGLLGSNLALFLKDTFEIIGLYWQHPLIIEGASTVQCDLSEQQEARRIVSEIQPDVVIHCASLTNVDQCERETALCQQMNHLTTKHVVEAIRGTPTKLVYISTDAVYQGTKGDYSELDPVAPQNYYGLTKYFGERECERVSAALILRANFFGWNILSKESLAEWILHRLQRGEIVSGFYDAVFSSLYAVDVARVIEWALRADLQGIYNIGTHDSCSKYEFARLVATTFGFDPSQVIKHSLSEHTFLATRGHNLSLCVDKLEHALATPMPTIKDSIERFYKDYQRTDILRNSGTIRQPSKYLSYGRHTIDGDDIEAVTVALKSTHLTQGPRVKHFEEAISNVTESRYAVAVNSGTSALHLACRAAGIGPGDEVITSPNTFVASANCVVYCGGRPIFADIDPHTYNIAPAEIARKITQRTKAVIPVHFAGQSCDMESIAQIVKEAEAKYRHRIVIIEDACHVFGSRYKGTPVGSCRFSDMVVMSFHPVKHITTGEGGAVLTNDPVLDRMVRKLRSHGITNDPKEFVYLQQGFSGSGEGMVNPWYYEQQELGYNYRLTDIQCALGISQIAKLELFQTRRRAIVRQYQSAFQDLPCIQRPFESPDCESIFHLYVLGIDFEKIGRSRAECMVHLNNRGIQTQVHYIPVHTQPFYQQQFGTHWGDCPRAEEYYRRCLSIPLSPLMTDRDVGRVIDEITALVRSHI